MAVVMMLMVGCRLKDSSPSRGKTARKLSPNQKKMEKPKKIRHMVVGPRGWYLTDPSSLGPLLDKWMDVSPDARLRGNPMAVIVPHAGYRYSGSVAGKVFGTLRRAKVRPLRVVILAVSHHYPLHGISVGDYTHYETPFGLLPVDREAVKFLLSHGSPFGFKEQAHSREHSLEMELPFMARLWKDVPIVPLLVGTMNEDELEEAGTVLSDLLNERTIIVASSDFTHRGPRYHYEIPGVDRPEELPTSLKKLDMGAWEAIRRKSALGLLAYKRKTGITMCGIWPVSLLLEVLTHARSALEPVLLDYKTSFDVTGDMTNTVSYLGIVFSRIHDEVWGLDRFERSTLHTIARRVLERVTQHDWNPREFDPDSFVVDIDMDPLLLAHKAAFVTLKKNGRLRGCIGYLRPHGPLWEAVARNAQSAALFDRRFRPVTSKELRDIQVEISVLSLPRKVKDYHEIQLGKHGITLYYQGHRATFLPQVAPEQGWDLETTLRHLARKAGLPENAYKYASYEVYTAQVF